MNILLQLLVGAVVGILVGITGTGGAFVIPALIYVFRMEQLRAQGTALMISSLPIWFIAFIPYARARHFSPAGIADCLGDLRGELFRGELGTASSVAHIAARAWQRAGPDWIQISISGIGAGVAPAFCALLLLLMQPPASSVLSLDNLYPGVRFQGLPEAVPQLGKGFGAGLVEQTLDQVQTSVVANRDHPLGGVFLGALANVGEGDLVRIFGVRSPEPPAVVLLSDFREGEASAGEGRHFVPQPGGKVLAEAAGIDKVWLHLPVLKDVSFNCNPVLHRYPRNALSTCYYTSITEAYHFPLIP